MKGTTTPSVLYTGFRQSREEYQSLLVDRVNQLVMLECDWMASDHVRLLGVYLDEVWLEAYISIGCVCV